MPSTPSHHLRSSQSCTFLQKLCSTAGTKLAPPIQDAAVVGYERRLDEKIWFTIKVTPRQPFVALGGGNTTNTKSRVRRSYYIARRYSHFTQFAQRLRHIIQPPERSLSGFLWRPASDESAGVAVPKIKGRLLMLPSKQSHTRRQQDLHHFVQAVLRLPSDIQQSTLVLEFFGCQMADTERQMVLESMWDKHTVASAWLDQEHPGKRRLRPLQSRTTPHLQDCSAKLTKSVSHPNMSLVAHNGTSNPIRPCALSHWKRRYSSSTVGKPPAATTSTTATTSTSTTTASSSTTTTTIPTTTSHIRRFLPTALSAHVRPKRSVFLPDPSISISTPLQRQESLVIPSQPLRQKSLSHLSIHDSGVANDTMHSLLLDSTISHSPCPSLMSSSVLGSSTIKFKVVYNVENIIVIQVPRTIQFTQLRERITLKFCDPATGTQLDLPPHFTLLYNDARSSASSTYADPIAGKATNISNELEFRRAMDTEWSCLQKVTLRCLAPDQKE